MFCSGDSTAGLKFIDSGTPLHDGFGVTIAGRDPVGFPLHTSHIETLSDSISLGYISGLRDMYGNFYDPPRFTDYFMVTKNEILEHMADFEDNGVIDNPIASIFDWPGKNNPFFEKKYGYPADGVPFGFIDSNFDNIYSPDQGEYPDIASNLLMPEAIVLKYFTNETDSRATLNFSVLIYGFDCSIDSFDLYNTLFVDYRMTSLRFEDIYFTNVTYNSNYALGESSNDYLAFDTLDNIVYCYNDPMKLEESEDAKNLVLSQYLYNGKIYMEAQASKIDFKKTL